MENQATKIVKLTTNQTVRIPTAIIKNLDLKEDSNFQIQLTPDGILLTPLIQVPKTQAYFWTKEWQAQEKKAEADIKDCRLKIFNNAKQLAKDLLS